MTPTPELETSRLLLKPLRSEDAVQIQQKFPRWEIVRYLISTVPWPFPEGAASHYVNNVALPANQNGSGWFWTLRRKEEPDELIGVISLMDTPDNNRGFWLVPEWQGQGLMSEACAAANTFWFETLGKDVLRAPKAKLNERSRNLSERSGMRLVRTQPGQYVSGELETELWELTRERWLELARGA
ncbi:N-acetyltransferase [Enterobacteriaceae bacterium 89]|nr:N-acetyltransferase [Enterobacteriaceae bacterium 89]